MAGRHQTDFVYIARGLSSGLMKIGCSWHPRVRIDFLVNEFREDIELLAAFAGDTATEAALHRRFAHLRATRRVQTREWFRDDGSIDAFVATLPDEARGSFVRRYHPPAERFRGHQWKNLPRFMVRPPVSIAAHSMEGR